MIFGSSANMCCLPESDMDLVLFVKPDAHYFQQAKKSSHRVLRSLAVYTSSERFKKKSLFSRKNKINNNNNNNNHNNHNNHNHNHNNKNEDLKALARAAPTVERSSSSIFPPSNDNNKNNTTNNSSHSNSNSNGNNYKSSNKNNNDNNNNNNNNSDSDNDNDNDNDSVDQRLVLAHLEERFASTSKYPYYIVLLPIFPLFVLSLFIPPSSSRFSIVTIA